MAREGNEKSLNITDRLYTQFKLDNHLQFHKQHML